MTIQILSRRSELLHDRPTPIRIGNGELCLNLNPGDPGLYFADSTPAPSTGLTPASGFASFSKGESWLDTSSTHIMKLWDGSAWQTPKAVVSRSAGKPTAPVDGQLHYDTAAAGLFMWDDGASSWVAI
jgi:hypothetical protein